MKQLLLFLSFCCIINVGVSQNTDLRFLPKAKREAILISIARDAMLTYGEKGYLEIALPPKIEKSNVLGKLCYGVLFPYDTTRYVLEYRHAGRVYIDAKTQKVISVSFGNGFGCTIERMEPGVPIQKIRFHCMTVEEFDDKYLRPMREYQAEVERIFREREKLRKPGVDYVTDQYWEDIRREREENQRIWKERRKQQRDSIRKMNSK